MENIINTVLLFIITGLMGSIALWLKKTFNKQLNRIDLHSFKITAIDTGCEAVMGDKYKNPRNEKFEDLIEENELKNKSR